MGTIFFGAARVRPNPSPTLAAADCTGSSLSLVAAAPVRAPGAHCHKICAVLASFIASSSSIASSPCGSHFQMCQGKQGGFHARKYFHVLFSEEMRIIFRASAQKRNSGKMV